MSRNGETHPDTLCLVVAVPTMAVPCLEVVAAASNSHDGLRIEVLEREKAAMQKVLLEQIHQISILVKQESKSRVIKSQMVIITGPADCCLRKLMLPCLEDIPKIGSNPCESSNIYDAFIEFIYQASVPTSAFEKYWTWLLFLGAEYEVAALKEECEQYFQGNVDINGANIVEVLELGLICGSQLLVRSAIDAHAQYHFLNLEIDGYRVLVGKYPQLRNLISQAESLQMARQFAGSNRVRE